MSFNKKLLWGGLGWVVAGPIGAILGYAYGSINVDPKNENFGLFKDGNIVDNDTFTYYFNPPRKLARLHITFRDWRGNLYDFNGLNHTLVFKVETATHKKMFSITK